MYLELSTVLVNFGLVMLGWMTQLVTYPGMTYYSESNLKRWHSLYTSRVTVFALPLMTSQLGLYGYAVFRPSGPLAWVLFGLTVGAWLTTFLQAVPLHEAIGRRDETLDLRRKLVRINWVRTILWSIIFIISLLDYGK